MRQSIRQAFCSVVALATPTLCTACAADATPPPGSAESANSAGAGNAAAGSNPAGAGDATGRAGSPATSRCSGDPDLQAEGCACGELPRGPCWSGPTSQRNVGDCHDGVHACLVSEEFSQWGPCIGEQRDCGERDAGPPEGCPCVPGAVIGCDEDCTANIICTLTAEKSCLPDGTWGPCRETVDGGIGNLLNGGTLDPATLLNSTPTIDLSNLGSIDPTAVLAQANRCRSYYHGCADATSVLFAGFSGFKETFMGDCSKQFTCGHAPSSPR